jgi:hypothetical protein
MNILTFQTRRVQHGYQLKYGAWEMPQCCCAVIGVQKASDTVAEYPSRYTQGTNLTCNCAFEKADPMPVTMRCKEEPQEEE